jgi:hypothetical protein
MLFCSGELALASLGPNQCLRCPTYKIVMFYYFIEG